jgi:transcriptional regulator with XRE-family HTH domain
MDYEGTLSYDTVMIDPKLAFGRRVRELRHERGWTQEELSFQSGLSRSYIADIERGKRNVALVNICALADAFNIETQEVMKLDRG